MSFYRNCFLLTVPAYEFEEGYVSKKECRYLKYLGEYSPPEDTPFSSEPRCTCDAHYMVANYRGVLYCINNFISPGGQVDNYTACTADCCSKNCGGFPDQVDHTLIIYGTIEIIQTFFYDLTMINLESYMVQSMVSLEPYIFIVQSMIGLESYMVQSMINLES